MRAEGSLLLASADRARLLREAAAADPEECCGLLLGRRLFAGQGVVDEVCAARNASVGDRRRSYTIDPLAFLAARERGRSRGREVIGFYHSHPDGSLRPSASDRAAAWAGLSYVIVTLDGAVASWQLRPDGSLAAEDVVEAEPGEGKP